MSFISADNTWVLWAVMVGTASLSIWLEQTYQWASKVTGCVLALVLMMILANFRVIPTDAPAYDNVWSYVVPLAVPLLIFATLVFTIVVTGVYGWAIERIAYRPLRNSTRLAPLISAIGMSLILQNYVQLSQGPNQQGIPTLLSGALRMTVGDGVVQITWTKVFILVAALVGMLILTWIIQYTRLGRICRATQQDRRMAAILGINTDRVISLVFVIGAAMAGLAGVLVTMNYGTFDFYIGFIIGIKAFTAAVLGGIGSLPGAMLGGLLLGVAEAHFAGLVNSDYKDVFSFALLVASLIFRPQGLLGRPLVAKV